MRLLKVVSILSLLIAGPLLVAQDDAKLLSGPAPGKFMPASFECFNINGQAAGRPRCLICKFALHPAVLIFSKETPQGKNEAFDDLLDKLEQTILDFTDRGFAVGVIFLSPDAKDSTNNPTLDKSDEIIDEALKREKLQQRLRRRAFGFDLAENDKKVTVTDVVPKSLSAEAGLQKNDRVVEAKAEGETMAETVESMQDVFRAAGKTAVGRTLQLSVERGANKQELNIKLKHVIFAYHLPEGPKGFNINPKAEHTVIFYDRMKVIENWTYAADKLQAGDVEMMMKRIREALPLKKKAVEAKT